MLLNAKERVCIQALARWFENGETEVNGNDALKRMELSRDEFNPLMRTMNHLGVIQIVLDDDCVDVFRLLPNAVQLARELDARAREASMAPDFVEQIQSRLRRNPVVGVLVVVFIAGAFLLSFADHLLSVLYYLGLLHS